jgi:hypothetical protein
MGINNPCLAERWRIRREHHLRTLGRTDLLVSEGHPDELRLCEKCWRARVRHGAAMRRLEGRTAAKRAALARLQAHEAVAGGGGAQ